MMKKVITVVVDTEDDARFIREGPNRASIPRESLEFTLMTTRKALGRP
jgi:hypothetical protein